MQIDSEEISEFVKAVLTGIDAGLPDGYAVATPVKFQLGIKSRKDKGGSLSLQIVGIGASRSSEDVARVEFEVNDMITVWNKKFDEWRDSQFGKDFLEWVAKKPPNVASP